jgi:hypothetical protein
MNTNRFDLDFLPLLFPLPDCVQHERLLYENFPNIDFLFGFRLIPYRLGLTRWVSSIADETYRDFTLQTPI